MFRPFLLVIIRWDYKNSFLSLPIRIRILVILCAMLPIVRYTTGCILLNWSCMFRPFYWVIFRRTQYKLQLLKWRGRAIPQAVSRRLPTAAARVQTRVWSCGFLWWTKVALGQVFSRELGFPLRIYIPSASPQSSSLSPEAGTIGQEWPQCQ
jgi:hypothetical protein